MLSHIVLSIDTLRTPSNNNLQRIMSAKDVSARRDPLSLHRRSRPHADHERNATGCPKRKSNLGEIWAQGNKE